MKLKTSYTSPRWSGELLDCSMPMTFDTYSVCSFNCLYCFSFFQKSHSSKGYLNKEINAVNVESVKKMFDYALFGKGELNHKGHKQFENYIKNRYVMQWGGLADGFDGFEKKYGVSLELLKYFDKIDYPLSISTKGTWWTEDDRYMSLVTKHAHNWHFKISIITLDPIKAKAVERGVSSPQERLKAIKRLSDLGVSVTLRLRPYIIGISDDFNKLIPQAKESGADSVTTEFFCLETRADERLKKKYAEMSKYCGFDLWEFYKKNSKGAGYRRLNYEIKRPIITEMQKIAHQLGMRFYVSDAHHKEKSDYCSCCGVPPKWKVSKGQFAEAVLIAKNRKSHHVYWDDIKPDAEIIVDKVSYYKAEGFNTTSNKARSHRRKQTLYEYMKEIWNTPKSGKSPYKYFEGILYPVGLDNNKNVIYKFNNKKSGV